MTVRISSPATISNLTCGFDILGMAIGTPFDVMEVKLLDEPVIKIKHKDAFGLSEDPEQNVAGVALNALMKACERKIGFEVIIDKQWGRHCVQTGSPSELSRSDQR